MCRDFGTRFGVNSYDARQAEQLERGVEVDGVEIHGLEDGCRARFHRRDLFRLFGLLHFAGLGVDLFDGLRSGLGFWFELGHVGSETAILCDDLFAVLRVDSDNTVADDGCVDQFDGFGEREFVGRQRFGNVDSTRLFGVVARGF